MKKNIFLNKLDLVQLDNPQAKKKNESQHRPYFKNIN